MRMIELVPNRDWVDIDNIESVAVRQCIYGSINIDEKCTKYWTVKYTLKSTEHSYSLAEFNEESAAIQCAKDLIDKINSYVKDNPK